MKAEEIPLATSHVHAYSYWIYKKTWKSKRRTTNQCHSKEKYTLPLGVQFTSGLRSVLDFFSQLRVFGPTWISKLGPASKFTKIFLYIAGISMGRSAWAMYSFLWMIRWSYALNLKVFHQHQSRIKGQSFLPIPTCAFGTSRSMAFWSRLAVKEHVQPAGDAFEKYGIASCLATCIDLPQCG